MLCLQVSLFMTSLCFKLSIYISCDVLCHFAKVQQHISLLVDDVKYDIEVSVEVSKHRCKTHL